MFQTNDESKGVGPVTKWPLQRDCILFYGDPYNSSFEAREIVGVETPWHSFFIGKPVKKIRVHRLCADAFTSWFDTVWENSGKSQEIINKWGMSNYGGAFNVRAMVGGRALSMHSYGCAIDFDAPRNGFKNRRPNIAKYREEIIEPFLRLGGVWGGDWDGDGDTVDERSCDGMHFQFARLR